MGVEELWPHEDAQSLALRDFDFDYFSRHCSITHPHPSPRSGTLYDTRFALDRSSACPAVSVVLIALWDKST